MGRTASSLHVTLVARRRSVVSRRTSEGERIAVGPQAVTRRCRRATVERQREASLDERAPGRVTTEPPYPPCSGSLCAHRLVARDDLAARTPRRLPAPAPHHNAGYRLVGIRSRAVDHESAQGTRTVRRQR